MSPPPRVRFDSLSKRYPGVQALDGVSFGVAAGGVHALVGENGAGKSTLVKVLAGATRADGGTIFLDGEAVQIRDARHAQRLGVAIVYQELNLAPDLTVAENVFLGRWPRSRGAGWIRRGDLTARTAALFDSLGVRLPPGRVVRGLSVAQQQMVEIARALSLDARVLVLDEPSAVLTPHELEALFALVRKLAAGGVSVIYISHRLEEIFELADAVTVMRDGRHISTRPVADVTRATLIAEMVGRPLEEEFPPRAATIGDALLRVDRLTAPRRFRDMSFEVRAGEVFGLTGLVGAGRSSVGRALFGDVRCTGRVDLAGTRGPFGSPRAAMRAGIAYVPEDRKQQGLLLARSVSENVTLAHPSLVSTAGVLRFDAERRIALGKMDELRVRAAGAEVAAGTLSGGNQQKVLLARWLVRPYRVVILDEPTRGVDVGAKAEIYALINDIAVRGSAVILISSELPEVIGMCDRIGVMAEGRLTGVLDNRPRRCTQEEILRLAVGEAAGRMSELDEAVA